MLKYALGFFIVAVIAGILGFGVIAGTLALIARGIFILFIILFIAALINSRRV